MKFEDMKKKQLNKTDKSSIGGWDVKIKGLCNKLNKDKKYYTTSSCAGRIVMIKSLKEKAKDVFLFRSHEKIGLSELKKAFVMVGKKYKGLVEFQQTTCILHVGCADLKSAQSLVNKAKLAGWKHSGIMASGKRFMIELYSTEKMSFPVMDKRKVLVDDYFLKIIVDEANNKLERAWKKIEKLKKMV
tara:strand:+ start:12690 stop:13250 length:561 start_codon:yes stop_codon:yes gene_type:complete